MDGRVTLSVQSQCDGHDNYRRDLRQPPGYRQCDEAPEAPDHHQLLRGVASVRGYSSGDSRDDVQRLAPADRTLDVQSVHV